MYILSVIVKTYTELYMSTNLSNRGLSYASTHKYNFIQKPKTKTTNNKNTNKQTKQLLQQRQQQHQDKVCILILIKIKTISMVLHDLNVFMLFVSAVELSPVLKIP